jgi:hypothetical protein
MMQEKRVNWEIAKCWKLPELKASAIKQVQGLKFDAERRILL